MGQVTCLAQRFWPLNQLPGRFFAVAVDLRNTLLALLARRGVRVTVLCATRGEAGSCGDPPLCRPDELGQVREAELRCACAALGIEPPRFLGYPDGTLSQVDEVQASEQIVRAVRELLPQTLLTWPPDRLSGHPDHIAVSRWTDQAFRQAADPAAYPEHQVEGLLPHAATWLYHLVVPRSLAEMLEMPHLHTVPDEAVTLKVDVSAVWKAKLAAIHCHHTQIGSSPILAASEAKQRLFLGMEYFRLAVSSAEFFSHRAGFAGSAGGIYHTDHPRRSP